MVGFESVLVSLLIVIEFTEARENESASTSITIEDNPKKNVSVGLGHSFFRNMHIAPDQPDTRRVYGGSAIELKQFPAVCALMDPNLSVRCTGTVIAPQWVLTAAHCVTPQLAYVKYNTRRPGSPSGGTSATVQYLYVHPSYKVVQVRRRGGSDVAELHHDVGLVRTTVAMELAEPPTMLHKLHRYNPFDLYQKDVKVLGYGRTERSDLGEELYGVDLRLDSCGVHEWVFCVCGRASDADPRGVCSGDSGGPVLYDGVLVGLTSMGPIECSQSQEPPNGGLTSVFTSVYQYADLINNTVQNKDSSVRMRRISRAPASHFSSELLILFILILLSVQ